MKIFLLYDNNICTEFSLLVYINPLEIRLDSNHRVKTVGKSIYALALLPKKESDVTKELAARMKTYWGTMLKQIRYLHWNQENKKIKEKVLAPVEHLFGNHKYCDAEWCYVLKAEKENKPYTPDPSRPLYDKLNHKKMYEQLTNAVKKFQSDENVKECLHKYDTQHNEALNMSVSRYVPKFKHYGTSMSLDTRVRCVIGAHNMGYTTYYKTLLTKLGCLAESDNENCHLSSGIIRIGKRKSCNKKYKQQLHVKRKRKHGQLAKTKQQLYEERVDRAKKLGTYETGVAILGQDDTQESSNLNQTRKQSKDKVCNSCGKTGHKTWRAKGCANHQQYLQSKGRCSTSTENHQK